MTASLVLADLPSLPLDERKALPDAPAIYLVLAGDTVLYIGQSVNVRQRWLAHHRFAQLNEYGGCRIAWMQVNDARLLDELERACVAHFSPLLNNQPIPGDSHYSLRLSPELHARLKKIAAEEDRSLQAQMLRLLDEAASQWGREHQPAGKP